MAGMPFPHPFSTGSSLRKGLWLTDVLSLMTRSSNRCGPCATFLKQNRDGGVVGAFQTHGHFSEDKPRPFCWRVVHPTLLRETAASDSHADEVCRGRETISAAVPRLQIGAQPDAWQRSRAQVKAPFIK